MKRYIKFSRAFLANSLPLLFFKKVSIFLLIGLSYSSLSADITVESDNISTTVMINGEITASDVQKVIDLPKKIHWLFLNSTGGDLDAAIKIGRIIRAHKATTMVPKNTSCYSSCALIYIAGVNRMNAGVVGLHRPYITGNPSSTERIKVSVPKMLSDISKYVEEMGITNSFTEIMINTPPESMQLFYNDEIEAVVPPTDPIYDEIQVAYNARSYGITTEEFRRRDALIFEACKHHFNTNQYSSSYICTESFYWGLSEYVFEQRMNEADKQCKISKDEMSILKKVEENDGEWRSHQITINKDKCIVNIMTAGAGN